MEVDLANMVEVPFLPDLDGVWAVGSMQTCGVAVRAALAGLQYSASYFGSGGMPLLAIQDDVSSESEAVNMTAKFRDALRRMSAKREKWIPLPTGQKVQPLGFDPRASQLVESRQFAISEIARCFHVPPSFLHDLRYGTYSNTAQADQALAKHTLRRWAEQIEQELTRALYGRFGPWFVEFDLSGLLRGDFKARAEALRALVASGIYSPDESRRDLGMGPGESDGSDQLFIQGAMRALRDVAAADGGQGGGGE